MTEGARFCGHCGAPVGSESKIAAAVPPQIRPVPPVPGTANRRRRGLWIAIAAAAVVIAMAIAVPLAVLAGSDGEDATTVSTHRPTTTSATTPPTTSAGPGTSATSTSSTTSTTAAPAGGTPGDSAGTWVEMDIPDVPAGVYTVSVSDEALLMEAQTDTGFKLYAHMFEEGELIEIPMDAPDVGGVDIDGRLAVWWEGRYDEEAGTYVDQRIYACSLPGGPKVEVAGGGRSVGFPQVAGSWVTWVEGSPWDENPDEYWRMPIFGVIVDSEGVPAAEPIELMSSPIASVIGDSFWIYSLSKTHLAWEQMAATDIFDSGTYVMDLGSLEPLIVGNEAWRPSIGGDTLVYWENGLKATDLASGRVSEIDPAGDFATAGPTFAVYFRGVERGDASGWDIVARGFSGKHEQVLGEASDAPWLTSAIAASAHHVAFVAGGEVHVFEWQEAAR